MRLLEKTIGLLAPHCCLGCGDEGSILCDWCLPDAIGALPSRCYRCKQLSPDSRVCPSCRQHSKLAHVWVRGNYEGLAKRLIYKFKYERASAAAKPLARLMIEALPWLNDETLIVHVPTATRRRRQRGYDHAELIAREIARQRGLTHIPLLARYGQSRQVGAKRNERLKQLQDSFYIRNLNELPKARILLVDDIVTTGGTLEAAAAVLKKAGAKSVDAIVLAQKQ